MLHAACSQDKEYNKGFSPQVTRLKKKRTHPGKRGHMVTLMHTSCKSANKCNDVYRGTTTCFGNICSHLKENSDSC